MTTLDRSYAIIQKPVITEKATDETAHRNAYTFRVPLDANKIEIRQAVEKLFEVKVEKVNTLRAPRKWRRRGRAIGQTQAWKRAMVVLAEDQVIEVM
jgi:large subunit ribosomal protein L23